MFAAAVILFFRIHRTINEEEYMRSHKFKIIPGIFLSVLVVAASFTLAQQNRTTRPQPDLKITYKVAMPGGMQSESTTMIKGVRERQEDHRGYGMDSINITQCDMRRTIQLSDKTRKYLITPMESENSSSTSTPPAATSRPSSAGPARRGGVITSVTTSTDTGERKEMFGFTARHVKTSIRMESSADACNPLNMHMEQDGWYIDLNFGLDCNLGGGGRPPVMSRPAPGGCLDQYRTRHVGTGRTGFPLIETTIGYDQNGNEQYRMTKEVADLSRSPLDAALFDIPAGYAETNNPDELNGRPDINAMAAAMGRNQATAGPPITLVPGTVPSESKRPGTIRVGVVQINNKTDHSVSTESLRERLIGGIQGSNIEAVPLNASSPGEADAEAKNKQCDFVLYTDISALKLSAAKKLGGMFGRATGVGSGGVDKTESKIDFKLIPVGGNSPQLQVSATGKEEGDDASAGSAIDAEAKAVNSAAKKRGN
jgi:hypothetical protein